MPSWDDLIEIPNKPRLVKRYNIRWDQVNL